MDHGKKANLLALIAEKRGEGEGQEARDNYGNQEEGPLFSWYPLGKRYAYMMFGGKKKGSGNRNNLIGSKKHRNLSLPEGREKGHTGQRERGRVAEK